MVRKPICSIKEWPSIGGDVAREHGGDVSLGNGSYGGLSALIELPA